MARRRVRVAKWVGIGVAVGIALALLAVWILTRTQFGADQVQRYVLGSLEDRIHGDLRVGRVTSAGGLLGGAMLHDVAIDDERGRPFLRADSARLGYDWRSFLRGDIAFERVWVYDPEVYIERLPGDTAWNFDYIFRDTVVTATGTESLRRLIVMEDLRIQDGVFVVRTPWRPSRVPVLPADTARLLLEPVPGGLLRVMRFDDIDARLPRVLWESPDEEGKILRIAALSGRAFIWEDPAVVRDLRGVVTIRDSIVAFDADRLRLEDSRASVVGTVITGGEKPVVDVKIEADRATLADLQWLYPPLPDEGSGSLTLRMLTIPTGMVWEATDARLRAPGTELAGDFGIATGDSLYFTRVDLRASPLDTELLAEILGDRLPIEGLLIGTVEVQGPLSALTTRADLRLASRGTDRTLAAATFSGRMNLRRGAAGLYGFTAEVRALDPDVVAKWAPWLRGLGTLSGDVRLNGGLASGLAVSGTVREMSAAGVSQVTGGGRMRFGARAALDLRLHAEPVQLAQVGVYAPGVVMAGTATGDVVLRGPTRELGFEVDLDTDAGAVTASGRMRRGAGDTLRVHVEAAGEQLAIARVLPRLAESNITGTATVDVVRAGAGRTSVAIASRLRASSFGDVVLEQVRLRGAVEDGVVRFDTLTLGGLHTTASAYGTLALDGARSSSLRATLDTDRLSAVLALLPLPDSLGPRLAERLDGTVRGEVEITGSPGALEARGLLGASDVAWDSLTARDALVRFTVTGVGSDSTAAVVDADARGLQLGTYALTEAHMTGSLRGDGGFFNMGARADDEHEYRVSGSFRRPAGELEFELEEAEVQAGGVAWTLERPGLVRLEDGGVRVDDLVLVRSRGDGRIEATGRLSWSEDFSPADPGTHERIGFRLALTQVPIAEVLHFARRDESLDGLLSGTVTIEGTNAAPRMRGDIAVEAFEYEAVRVDRVDAQLAYADRVLDIQTDLLRGQHTVLRGAGRVPLDLALGPVADRHLDEPLHFALRADSLPAALAAGVLNGLSDVSGTLEGTLIASGTTRDPALSGELVLRRGGATLAASGVHYRDLEATMRVMGERVLAITGTGRSNGGTAHVTGNIVLDRLADPQLDLQLAVTDFEAVRRREVALTATGQVRLTGRYRSPVLTGGLRVDRGALHIDELTRQVQVVELETPLLFDVVDTSLVGVQSILPPSTSPFIRGMIVAATVGVGRDFWLRSEQMNVELSGELSVDFDSRAQDLRLTGSLGAVRGVYNLLGRRFEVRQGTVEFAGTPGVDPNLDILAIYRVRLSEGDPLDIHAQLTGTLRAPRVSLSTEADVAISQSDLASYLVFGRPTYELAPSEIGALQLATHGAALTTAVVGPSLFGFAAAELESAAQGLGAVAPDYVSITAAEASAAAYDPSRSSVFGSWLAATEVQIGYYLSESLFVSASQRVGASTGPGVRLEWRFHPTWSAEAFLEDRFARLPDLTLEEPLDRRKVGGFFLFREWGY